MNITEAIEILTFHQRRRLEDEPEIKITTKQLKAFDKVLKYVNAINEIEKRYGKVAFRT